MGLTGIEAEYFFYLVLKDRAGTQRLKKMSESKLEVLKQRASKLENRIDIKKVLSDQDKAIFYSKAIFSAVHLFTSTSEQGRTFQEIVDRFELSREKALKIIEFLKSSELIKESNNRYSMGAQSTHVDALSPYLINHLTNWRLKAIDAGRSLSEEELIFTSNVSLAKKDFLKLKEEMLSFIQNFLKQVHASPAEEIATLNLDFFWIRKAE